MEVSGASAVNGYDWIRNVSNKSTVLICDESALAYAGIGSYNEFEFMQVKSTDNISGVYTCTVIDSICLSNTIRLSENIHVVRPERAICDLICDNGDLFHLLEAIDECFNYDDSIPEGFSRELCLELIRECDMEDRFNELLEESKTIYDE